MLDHQGNASNTGHASHQNVQEVGLRQYTAARLAQREEIARTYSPEPHLEMMRPVSPFQNTKRHPMYSQNDHQQPKVTHPPAHRPINANPGVRGPRPAPSSASQAVKRPTRVQEPGPSAASTVHASTRSKPGLAHNLAHNQSTAHKGKARDARRALTQDSRTNAAVQTMNVRSSTTPASSETDHTNGRSGGAPSQSQSHALDSADEFGYLSSPEKGASSRRKKDPSWRKPAPKYVPTPPSTPPTAGVGPLGTVREDLIPPMPSMVYDQPQRVVYHGKNAQEPPPRPARALSVPPNSHMSTSSKAAVSSSFNKSGHTQRAAPTKSQAISLPRKPSPPIAERTPSKQSHNTNLIPQAHLLNTSSSSRSHSSSSQPHVVAAKAQVQSRAASPSPFSAPPQPTMVRKPSPKPEAQKHLVVYPEPKRVPSLAQLVEQARPTRTPSPRVPPKDTALETKQDDTRTQTRTATPVQIVPIISVTSAVTVQQDLLLPPQEQVLLPPSVNASAKSSRSPSPRPPTPLRAPSPIPDRTRSRSPVPVNIPQYAPPPPPYTSPPPNTPLAAPKPRFSVLFQAQIAATLAEKMVTEEDEPREEVAHTTPKPAHPLTSSVPSKREPVSKVPETQRHSGLATPPHTPPGRVPSRTGAMNTELPAVEQSIPTERSRSVNPPVSSASVVAQQIQTQKSVKKAPVVQSSLSGKRALTLPTRPVSPARDGKENPPLPPNWLESIVRMRDNPEPEDARTPVEVQTADGSMAASLPPVRDGTRRRPMIISEIIDAEHAPKLSESEANEKLIEPPQASNALHIAVPQQLLTPPEEFPQRSRSPRPIPIPPPTESATVPEARSIPEHSEIASSHLLAPLPQLQLPGRTRSPVPRKTTPQQQEVTVQRCSSPINHATEQELDGFVPVVALSENPVQPFSSSSDAPKKSKSAKSKHHTIDNPKVLVIPRKEDPRPLTPPPRAPSRSATKASETPGKQATNLSALWSDQLLPSVTSPSSPPPVVRPLSPSPKNHFGQTTTTASHHAHKNHEVIQPFRPPTPPTTSHYRKKRSFDLLPTTEGFTSFMKPPVHVIYPDASSHDHSYHSFSGDTATLNANDTAKSINTVPKVDDGSTSRASLRKTAQSPERAQSPDFMKHLFENKENLLEIPDEEPTVPPKSPTETPLSSSLERLPDFVVQHAMRGPVRYPSAPIGESRAHTLTLPPSLTNEPRRYGKSYSAVRPQVEGERARSRRLERREGTNANAFKAARSHSEKHTVDNVRPMARSRSTPLPHGSRNRSRKGFWQIVGAWARQVATKLKTWATPSSSPPASPAYNRYHDHDYDY